MKWEYLVTDVPILGIALHDALNEFGAKGWALVTMERRGSHYECVFIRSLEAGR